MPEHEHDESCPVHILSGPETAAAFIAEISGSYGWFAHRVLEFLDEQDPTRREELELELRGHAVTADVMAERVHAAFCPEGTHDEEMPQPVPRVEVVETVFPANASVYSAENKDIEQMSGISKEDWVEHPCVNPKCSNIVTGPPASSILPPGMDNVQLMQVCSAACALAVMLDFHPEDHQ